MNNHELDLVIRARRLIGPDGEHGASIGVRGGVITVLDPFTVELSAPTVVSSPTTSG